MCHSDTTTARFYSRVSRKILRTLFSFVSNIRRRTVEAKKKFEEEPLDYRYVAIFMYRKRRDRNRRRRYMPRTFTAKAAKATCPRIRRGFPTSLSYLRSSTKFFLSFLILPKVTPPFFYSIQGPRESLLPPPPPLHCQLDSNTPHDCPGTRSVCDDDAKKGFSVLFFFFSVGRI